jgi:hypothetical protein
MIAYSECVMLKYTQKGKPKAGNRQVAMYGNAADDNILNDIDWHLDSAKEIQSNKNPPASLSSQGSAKDSLKKSNESLNRLVKLIAKGEEAANLTPKGSRKIFVSSMCSLIQVPPFFAPVLNPEGIPL